MPTILCDAGETERLGGALLGLSGALLSLSGAWRHTRVERFRDQPAKDDAA